jgi:hypothetical protein
MTGGPAWKEKGQVAGEYEQLRANALGATNRPCGLAVLMRHGMGAWLDLVGRAVPAGPEGCGRGSACGSGEGTGIAQAVAVVLVDAVLAMRQHATGVRA